MLLSFWSAVHKWKFSAELFTIQLNPIETNNRAFLFPFSRKKIIHHFRLISFTGFNRHTETNDNYCKLKKKASALRPLGLLLSITCQILGFIYWVHVRLPFASWWVVIKTSFADVRLCPKILTVVVPDICLLDNNLLELYPFQLKGHYLTWLGICDHEHVIRSRLKIRDKVAKQLRIRN